MSNAAAVEIDIEEPRSTVRAYIDRERFLEERTSVRSVPVVTRGLEVREKHTTRRHEAGETVPLDTVGVGPNESLLTDISPGAHLGPGDTLEFDSHHLRDAGSLVIEYRNTETHPRLLFASDFDPDQSDSR